VHGQPIEHSWYERHIIIGQITPTQMIMTVWAQDYQPFVSARGEKKGFITTLQQYYRVI